MNRAEIFRTLTGETFDVLVIGGGITGAGVARDAAMRGMRVALVEKDDFASGTSSRSSRLVHGGVRYLEHGQFRLVFESSRERRTLLRIAPHLVQPLRFTWPVYSGARVPLWKLSIGLTAYDVLSLFRNPARHKRLSANEVSTTECELLDEALTGGAEYWDASTDDARLTLANILSAAEAGGVVVNHAATTSIRKDADEFSVHITDAETRRDFPVRTRIVVNATGPWSDATESLANGGHARESVRGSKGVHIAVSRARLRSQFAVTLLAPQDGRVMFVLPAGEFTIVGTTDTFDASSPDEVRASETDVEYLLDAANHFFPAATLAREDVISAWAGLRPLAAVDDAIDASDASREHVIAEPIPGMLSVTGGKLTTYRSMAEEIVDRVERALGRSHIECRTSMTSLAGGEIKDVQSNLAAARTATGDEIVARHLLQAYGSLWTNVWKYADASALRAPLADGLPYLTAEIRYAIDREMARTFGDLLIRRTHVAFETRDHGLGVAHRILPLVSEWLGWSPEKSAAELRDFTAEIHGMFNVEPA